VKPPVVDPREVDFTAIRAQGAGGQNVNKVSSAAHLRFDIGASSLPEAVKARLLALADSRIGGDGVVVIKAQDHRSLPRNQADALARLQDMVDRAAHVPKARRATKCAGWSRRRGTARPRRRGAAAAVRRTDSGAEHQARRNIPSTAPATMNRLPKVRFIQRSCRGARSIPSTRDANAT
jgi:ribosome-associated protein